MGGDNTRAQNGVYEMSVHEIMYGIPEIEALFLADALLFAVYGWNPDKVRKMKLSSIRRWVGYAKKRIKWEDAYKLRKLLKGKEISWWRKALKIKS